MDYYLYVRCKTDTILIVFIVDLVRGNAHHRVKRTEQVFLNMFLGER